MKHVKPWSQQTQKEKIELLRRRQGRIVRTLNRLTRLIEPEINWKDKIMNPPNQLRLLLDKYRNFGNKDAYYLVGRSLIEVRRRHILHLLRCIEAIKIPGSQNKANRRTDD